MPKAILADLSSRYEKSLIYYDKKTSELSSMHVGGKPLAFIDVETVKDLSKTFKFFNSNKNYRVIVMGKGTNLIFSEKLEDIVLISLGEYFNNIIVENEKIICSAATPLQALVRKTAEVGLSGIEWAMGIPGTLGGAIVNNSGIAEYSINDLVKKIEVMDLSGNIFYLSPEDLKIEYRETEIKQKKNYTVLSVEFELEKKDRMDVLKNLNNHFMLKQKNQPLNAFSSGCIFKNPKKYSAGKLIDDCGLKGYKIGGAKVSELHANFIVNYSNAVYSDIKNLIIFIQNAVYEKYKVNLELEVEIIGD